MSFRNPTSVKDIFLHIGAIVTVAFAMILIVFYLWLPTTTNHGDTITVPDIGGFTLEKLDEFLSKRSLRFEVTNDSSYSPDQPPLTVLRQVPPPNSKVKENRKVYVTLNAETPPLVRMPKVIDLHMKSAQMVLKSYGLKVGEVKFSSDAYFGVILDAQVSGRMILEGEKIEKGSVIDLIAGDGYGNIILRSPNLIGLDKEEAQFVIIGSGLKVGKIQESKTRQIAYDAIDRQSSRAYAVKEVAPGEVQQQYPETGVVMQIGDIVDLWIYAPDSLSSNSTLLDGR